MHAMLRAGQPVVPRDAKKTKCTSDSKVMKAKPRKNRCEPR